MKNVVGQIIRNEEYGFSWLVTKQGVGLTTVVSEFGNERQLGTGTVKKAVKSGTCKWVDWKGIESRSAMSDTEIDKIIEEAKTQKVKDTYVKINGYEVRIGDVFHNPNKLIDWTIESLKPLVARSSNGVVKKVNRSCDPENKTCGWIDGNNKAGKAFRAYNRMVEYKQQEKEFFEQNPTARRSDFMTLLGMTRERYRQLEALALEHNSEPFPNYLPTSVRIQEEKNTYVVGYEVKPGWTIKEVREHDNHGLRSYVLEHETGCTKKVSHSRIEEFLDPMHRSAFGVGYIGIGVKSHHEKKAYETWKGMFHRCYHEEWLEKCPTYRGCEVAEEWHCFQDFLPWFNENYPFEHENADYRWELDKDTFSKGCKLYSKDTCCFLPQPLNISMTTAVDSDNKKRKDLPQGVSFTAQGVTKQYVARLKVYGDKLLSKLHATVQEGFDWYCEQKLTYIQDRCNQYPVSDRIKTGIYNQIKNHLKSEAVRCDLKWNQGE